MRRFWDVMKSLDLVTSVEPVVLDLLEMSGKGWENHVEGQKLKADGDSFRLKLNTQEIFEDWARKVQQRNLGVSGRIFTIDTQRTRIGGRGNTLRLRVNFLPEIITLAKEVLSISSSLLIGLLFFPFPSSLEKSTGHLSLD